MFPLNACVVYIQFKWFTIISPHIVNHETEPKSFTHRNCNTCEQNTRYLTKKCGPKRFLLTKCGPCIFYWNYYFNVVSYVSAIAERCAIWPCLNVATWRRERSDRAIQQICQALLGTTPSQEFSGRLHKFYRDHT